MKIKVTEKTTFEGVTYYYLYIDDQFLKLSRAKADIDEAVETATGVYKSGKHIETTIYETELN